MEKLYFGKGNAKLKDGDTLTFSLPAGHTCPGAKDCKAMVHPEGGHLIQGPHAKFRCSAASEELRLTNVRDSRWRNYGLLTAARTQSGMSNLLRSGIACFVGVTTVRIHTSGDFFSEKYFKAWLSVARTMPDLSFYAYTRSLPFWVNNMDKIPDNMLLTASRGGVYDQLIDEYNLKNVTVVFHPEDAGDLEIDHDDSHAKMPGVNFALLLHNVQASGSEAAEAIKRMKREAIDFGYRK